ncbi:hypothetical protein DFH28DRAFT_926634 [Melampsora americana]|nr:hypothetical protein DFH28DRAFT_926634 [Melampsora americana]
MIPIDKMILLYLKGTRKLNIRLIPRCAKSTLMMKTGVENLYLEAWLWFCDEAKERSKLYPLPEWGNYYCQVATTGQCTKRPRNLSSSNESFNKEWDVEERDVVKQKKEQKFEPQQLEPTVAIPVQRIKVKLGPPPKSHQSEVMVINYHPHAASSLSEEGIEEIDKLESKTYQAHHVNKSNHHNNKPDHDKIQIDHEKDQTDNDENKFGHDENKTNHGLESAQSQYLVKGNWIPRVPHNFEMILKCVLGPKFQALSSTYKPNLKIL